MSHLPVIVGFGGINSAGRTSFHHGFKRYVFDKLSPLHQMETLQGLATLTGILRYDQGHFSDSDGNECLPGDIAEKYGDTLLKATLLRKVGNDLFDADAVAVNKKITLKSCDNEIVRFELRRRDLPNQLPDSWKLEDIPGRPKDVRVTFKGELELLLPDQKEMIVKTAAQLPSGFDPAALYPSRNHPRGIQMAVFAASDALRSMGMNWDDLKQLVAPDQIGVYASSAMGQLDTTGTGGMLKAGVTSQRATSKQLAMGLVQMPSDFINAYVIGNVGHTSAQVGACATLLYNLNQAIQDIQMGKRKIAIVGSSESPLIPEIFEGYRVMSALGEDQQLLKLDRRETGIPDYSRALRPFSENCGFALGESAQYFILFADDLALELGAQIFGAVGGIFINADGYKKSISSPGFGNYISLAKAMGLTRSIIGEKQLRHDTFVSAHGTGTPQNRTTESHGLNEIAKAFHIDRWPVSAIKCYVGHSLASASGDQLAAVLGTWEYGLIPGIFTLDRIAEDVHQSNLLLSQHHIEVDKDTAAAALINAKGFGGNNATGVILSPQTALQLIAKRHGETAVTEYHKRNESVRKSAEQYDQAALQGTLHPIYRFGENVLEGDALDMTDAYLSVRGLEKGIDLNIPNPYL